MARGITRLRGITWGHTRGYLPMVATAQRFRELYPSVQIDWQVESLQDFADASIGSLAREFDLLVIDHPSVGHAVSHNALAPLDECLPEAFLSNQARNSVGRSHVSYFYEGHQWALAIDAAAPISGWRADLLERENAGTPSTWDELLVLARRGLVVVPAIPVDSINHLLMLCCALGEEPFQAPGHVAEKAIVVRALEMLRELLSHCDPRCFSMNPIGIWDFLARSEKAAYCAFAYGYSNYSRDGYGEHVLDVGGLISIEGRSCRSVLGGAGLAISRLSENREVAAEYAQYVADPRCQGTLYFDSGGQPGSLEAWHSPEVNRRSNNFFQSTLPVLEQAYLRPRFDGYLGFQEAAGKVVYQYLVQGGSTADVADKLDRRFSDSEIS